MLFPAEMKSATMIMHRAYQEELIFALHEAGIMEITSIRDSKSGVGDILEQEETHPKMGKCTEYKLRVDRILGALEEVREDKTSILRELFRPTPIIKTPVKRRNVDRLLDETESIFEEVEDAISIKSELSTIEEGIDSFMMQRNSIELLKPFDFDLSYMGESKYLYIVAGTVELKNYDRFIENIDKVGIDTLLLKEKIDDERYITIIATLSENKEKLDDALRGHIFDEVKIGHFEGKPLEVIEGINEELKQLKAHKDELLKKLKKMDEKWGRKLLTLQEELEIEKERMACPSKFGRTRDAIVIEGWVASKDVDELKGLCDRTTDGHVFCELKAASATPTEIPIKYDNPRWLKPFEFLTTMFGRPKYDEIDPTIFIAPILVLFFGFMLGDVAYGLLIIAIGYMLYQGVGKVSNSMHDMSIVLMTIGASAAVFGVWQGGYFGDFLPFFLGINPPFVLLDPLKNPVAVLQIALVIGIIHINLGLLIAAYQNIRRKNYRDILHGQIAWFIIQPCAAILIFSFFGWAAIESQLITAAGVGSIIGMALILIKQGPLGLFGFTGFLGDWLSYARILALALATFGIAMTVNILTKMVADIHPVMIILAALVFVVGQTFNFALQSLGAFIHSLRLQYVEFFGKFYVGGGKEFIPFGVMRRYTELIDEKGENL